MNELMKGNPALAEKLESMRFRWLKIKKGNKTCKKKK